MRGSSAGRRASPGGTGGFQQAVHPYRRNRPPKPAGLPGSYWQGVAPAASSLDLFRPIGPVGKNTMPVWAPQPLAADAWFVQP